MQASPIFHVYSLSASMYVYICVYFRHTVLIFPFQETHKREHIIPMHVEHEETIKSKQMTDMSKDTATSANTAFCCKEASDIQVKKLQNDLTAVSNLQEAQSRHENEHTQNRSTVPKNLPISVRGPFYSDSFFNDNRENYATAIRKVMEKANERSSLLDAFTSYRCLRRHELTRENQAVHVEENDQCLKVIIILTTIIPKSDTIPAIVEYNIIDIHNQIHYSYYALSN